MKKIRSSVAGSVAVALSTLAYVACDDSSSTVKEPSPIVDAGPGTPDIDSGFETLPDGGTKDCFDNPKTHFEIINACTNATKISKNPVLPKLLADGGLPPLD